MKLNFTSVGLFLLAASAFTACKSDSPAATTVSEDKTNIQASLDSLSSNLDQLSNGSFFQAEAEFLNINGGVAQDINWADSVFNGFGDVVDDNNVFTDGRFVFSGIVGKYTWNKTSATWTKTTNSTLVALFPSSKTSTTNNCEFGITKYTDQSVTVNGSAIYLPTAANVYLKKDNVQIASLVLGAAYNTSGLPVKASVQLYLKPATTSISAARKADNKYGFAFSIVNENNKANGFSVESDVTFATNVTNYTELSDAVVNSVQLTVSQGKLAVSGTIDVKAITALENSSSSYTTSDINKTIDLAVLYNSQNIGKLKVKDVGDTRGIFIVYKDSTEENTSIYYDSFVSDLKSIYNSNTNVSSVKKALKAQFMKAKVQKLKNKMMFWK
jgi:hypothetical protein